MARAKSIHLPFFPICEKLTVEKNFLFQIFDRNHGFQDEILPNSAAECSLCRRRIGDDGAESFKYFKYDFYFYFRKSPDRGAGQLDNGFQGADLQALLGFNGHGLQRGTWSRIIVSGDQKISSVGRSFW